MFKIFAILFTIIITSFYYFPLAFMFLPTVNTKLMLAVVGLIFYVYDALSRRSIEVKTDYVVLFSLSLVFSLICFVSVVINSTSDYAYTTYFMSMLVWMFGAYSVCNIIKLVHKHISVEIVMHYLIAVCVIQCFWALLIDNNASVKLLVDSVFFQAQDFLTEAKRLYGIGAMLDTAGIRFSIVLIFLSYLMCSCRNTNLEKFLPLYFISFIILTIIGCMMARTTTIGSVLGLSYLCINQMKPTKFGRPFTTGNIIYGLLFLIVGIGITVYFYQTNASFHKEIRFAFEGFFSLVEKGTWEVGSNEQLKSMVVLPETMKTWIIGDGYFSNPKNTDPYFIGKIIGGYYMGTDIGYLRFIYYCGFIGLSAFSLYMLRAGVLCIHKYPHLKMLCCYLLMVNFICWAKVSTDTFLIFALIMMIDKEEDPSYGIKV